jgi:hypothetical protein
MNTPLNSDEPGDEIQMDRFVGIRMREADYERLQAIVADNPGLYESESHFIRCAILRQIRHYKDVEI